EHLRRCLRSLEEEKAHLADHSFGAALEVFVVDNASADDSVSVVTSEFPWVNLIRSDVNLGFARANNQGMRRCGGRYVMLLNPDTVVKPGSLRALIDFMDGCSEAGAVGPRLLNPDGSIQFSCRSYPGIGAGLFRNTPLGRLFPNNRFLRHYLMTDFGHEETRPVDWLSGACLMVRREVLDQVGLLDEDFFMYCEDTDWCYRMERRGWKKYYLPAAEVIHVIGGSSDLRVPAMVVAHHRSMCRFYFKHYFFGWRSILMPAMLGGIWLRCLLALLRYYASRWRVSLWSFLSRG
ncbi:MAG: glycosyltransferase family 2 protein, partial [Armatimonadetes bacterium]|nr:glycosyltransferase family 2 protein [Armatimonadota bacterium]